MISALTQLFIAFALAAALMLLLLKEFPALSSNHMVIWAMRVYKRALAIFEKALGPEHPDVGTNLNNLATLHRDKGEYVKAEPLDKRALTIREKALGPEHPYVATSLENYATLLRKNGRATEATKMEAHAKAIRAKHAEQDPAK